MRTVDARLAFDVVDLLAAGFREDDVLRVAEILRPAAALRWDADFRAAGFFAIFLADVLALVVRRVDDDLASVRRAAGFFVGLFFVPDLAAAGFLAVFAFIGLPHCQLSIETGTCVFELLWSTFLD